MPTAKSGFIRRPLEDEMGTMPDDSMSPETPIDFGFPSPAHTTPASAEPMVLSLTALPGADGALPDSLGALPDSIGTWSAWNVFATREAALHDAHAEADSPVTDVTDSLDTIHVADLLRASIGAAKTGGGGGSTTLYTDYYAGKADGTAGYDIWLQFKGTAWTAETQQPFITAADYFTKVITADIGGNALINGKMVDDLYVTAELKAIDGPGGILGQAGPTKVWTAAGLTATGTMQFDSADVGVFVKNGQWDDVVTHEFMHALGFGSLWNAAGHSLAPNSGQYIGPKGLEQYKIDTGNTGASYIPVETGGGSGTAGSHWAEASLTNELMTGWTDPRVANIFKNFSVMSMADLGYSVDLGRAAVIQV